MHSTVTNMRKEDVWIIETDESLTGSVPSGTLIADSDRQTFVYLVDRGDTYGYVHFPVSMWGSLLQAVEEDAPIGWKDGDEWIELERLKEELDMMLVNIEGNGNYGETFTSLVEKQFHSYIEQLNDQL
ncbi:hypothetical protein GOP80_11020 [Planococcaceae bacterium Storch 2/2-2]|nr:hypothetical protein [Planococcaceae bacterium Storch 2/2-2]